MAGLAVPPDEDLVARLEEDDPGPDPATLERAAHGRQSDGRISGADIDHDGDPSEPLAVRRHELGEFGQELAGQVVDDGVAEILEQLRRGGLATPGQPAEDHDGRFGDRIGRGSDLGRLGHRPLR